MAAGAFLRPAHPEEFIAHLERRSPPALLDQGAANIDIPFVLLELPLDIKRLVEIQLVGILHIVHRQFRQVGLRQR